MTDLVSAGAQRARARKPSSSKPIFSPLSRAAYSYELLFHEGVWLKSGALATGPDPLLNVGKLLRPGNKRGDRATIYCRPTAEITP
jgi:hypothetical protein